MHDSVLSYQRKKIDSIYFLPPLWLLIKKAFVQVNPYSKSLAAQNASEGETPPFRQTRNGDPKGYDEGQGLD
jgi:hypothetical protein